MLCSSCRMADSLTSDISGSNLSPASRSDPAYRLFSYGCRKEVLTANVLKEKGFLPHYRVDGTAVSPSHATHGPRGYFTAIHPPLLRPEEIMGSVTGLLKESTGKNRRTARRLPAHPNFTLGLRLVKQFSILFF
jgi:hypothetical protein